MDEQSTAEQRKSAIVGGVARRIVDQFSVLASEVIAPELDMLEEMAKKKLEEGDAVAVCSLVETRARIKANVLAVMLRSCGPALPQVPSRQQKEPSDGQNQPNR